MTVGDETQPGNADSGRHGGTGGLSAAELIARARSAAPAAPSAPTRASRHSRAEAPIRHLSAVQVSTDTERLPDIEQSGLLAPEKKSGAGRNLPMAILVGVGLAGIIVASLYTYRPSFVIVVALASVIGVYELVTAISTVEARPPLVLLVVEALAIDVAAWFRGPDGLVGALLLSIIGVAIWRLGDGATGYLRDVAAGVFVAVYLPFLAGFAILLAHAEDGAPRVVLFVAAVVCSDTGGYAAGVLLGRHPMAPTISPKKSWEGFLGSVIACCVCGALVMELTFHQQWWQGLVFGLAIAVTATLGDLGESMIKRDLGLKDMGKLLPGHGGVMDRLDSLLPCAAVAYLLLSVFA